MRSVKTIDGSYTLYNNEFKETYHSISGAIEEAFKKYIAPCEIEKYASINILDICFGLGYNSMAAISTSMQKEIKTNIVALERDNLLKDLDNLEIPNHLISSFNMIKEGYEKGETSKDNINLKVVLGDARQTIQKVKEQFDVVFLDPFSTMKNPELWSVDFFREIKKRMKPSGILSTYSSSAIVRGGLLEAGFSIGNGPIVGRARPSTLAGINKKFPELSDEDKKLIRAFGTSFKDPKLNWDKNAIIQSRLLSNFF